MSKEKDYRSLAKDEQVLKRDELIETLRKHRFSVVMGRVENPMQARYLRRKIACLNTLIHEKVRQNGK